MSKSIGIDLGTTNSVAAIRKVQVEVLKNSEGDFVTPSCVSIKKNLLRKSDFVVGRHALDWMKQDPANTVTAVKRLMGRSFDDEEVRQVTSGNRFRYRVKAHSRGTENSLAIVLDAREFTPEQISAEILKKLKRDAERALTDQVEYAVITVPAYFNDKQKHATRTAAALAGLKVLRLLPEPTAAAISFGVDNIEADESSTVLVFDFGGGTLDLSVLIISGGQFIEQSKGGDMWLGGEDIDQSIVDYALLQTAREYEIKDIDGLIDGQSSEIRNRFRCELKSAAEKAKIRLSDEQVARVEVLGILRDEDGDVVDVDVELTRDYLNRILEPVIDSIIRLTSDVISGANMTKELIDKVLLVGGSSRIPRIIQAIEEEFGPHKVLVYERPMLAVAEGAAILSHRLADTYECPKCGKSVSRSDLRCANCEFDLEKYTVDQGVFDIVHSAAHDYFIHLENDERHLMVQRNTPLPCSASEVFSLIHPDQRLVHMRFSNTVNDQQERIGDLWLGIDRETLEKKKETENLRVEITMQIDENNLAEVSARLKDYPEVALSKTLSRGKADEKLFVSLEETINQANLKKYDIYVMLNLLDDALSVIKDINHVVNPETNEVDEQSYNRAASRIAKAARMAEENLCTRPLQYYAENMLEEFGPLIPHEVARRLRKEIDHLKETDQNGSYEQSRAAVDAFENVMKTKDLSLAHILMRIKKAGDYCERNNSPKAPRFFRKIEDVIESYYNADAPKIESLLDEIMPEVEEIVEAEERKSGEIFKDIRKR
ncbi:MAG: Hsp70 family protein [Deltaproteobacteria bacterium]|nr:Hsp70 family protein [Deltaproteobacteria bacterium]